MYKNKAENGNNNLCGQKVKALREKLSPKTSQKKLADMLQIMGVSIYCERKAEQGVFPSSLHADALLALSHYFHLRPSTFFAPTEEWCVDMLLYGEKDL